MIRNKRGDNPATSQLPWIVLGIVLLAIVFLTLYFYGGALSETLKILFPTLSSKTNEVTTGIVKIRYSVLGNSIQYYDGKSWLPFEKNQIIFDDKFISLLDLETSFDRFYFSQITRDANSVITLDLKARDVLYAGDSVEFVAGIPLLDAHIVGLVKGGLDESEAIYHGGDVLIRLYPKGESNDHRTFGEFVVSIDNQARFRKVVKEGGTYTLKDSFETLSNPSKEYLAITIPLISSASQWRDSVFSKPIDLTYYTVTSKGERGDVQHIQTCVLYLDKMLIVDFNTPQSSCQGVLT